MLFRALPKWLTSAHSIPIGQYLPANPHLAVRRWEDGVQQDGLNFKKETCHGLGIILMSILSTCLSHLILNHILQLVPALVWASQLPLKYSAWRLGPAMEEIATAKPSACKEELLELAEEATGPVWMSQNGSFHCPHPVRGATQDHPCCWPLPCLPSPGPKALLTSATCPSTHWLTTHLSTASCNKWPFLPWTLHFLF